MARVARYVTGLGLRRDIRGAVVPPSDQQWHRAVGQVRQGAQEATARDPRALPLASAQQRDRGHQQQDQGDHANDLSTPRLAATQPARSTPLPPGNSLYEKTLTLSSPADRPVGAPRARRRLRHRHSYPWRRLGHRRTGMQTPAPCPVSRAAPDRRPATDCRQTRRRRCRSFTLAASPTTAPRDPAGQMSRFQVWPSACLLAPRYPAGHRPRSTLHPRPCEWRRMTRGRRGSLTLRRMTHSSTTALPALPAHRRCS